MNKKSTLSSFIKLKFFIFLFPVLVFSQTQIGSDINGEAANDLSGASISISSDGNFVAIGAPYNDGNGINSGQVRVYQNISGVWTQIGSDINGEATENYCGISTSISSNGTIVAVAGHQNDGNGVDSGHVRVYQNMSGVWTQIGTDIDGENTFDLSGFSISLSSNGNKIAIGAPYNDGNGNNSGHVRIYENVSGNWIQIGSDIDGEAAEDLSGFSVALSSDGNIVAIGAQRNDGNGGNSGHVRVFQNISGIWTQVGSDIDGEAANDFSGTCVSISSNGNTVAIGAPFNDGNGSDSGHVRVYQNISGIWTQVGSDINGAVAGDQCTYSVSLSGDGNIVAMGSTLNDSNGANSGHVRVFQNILGTWTQIGSSLNGEAVFDENGTSVALTIDGSKLATGASFNNGNGTDSGHVRVYDLSTILSNTTFEVENSISIYPNPFSDVIKFNFNGYINGKIETYSLDGKLVFTKDCKEINQLETDLSELENGVYIARITSNDSIITKKIIKE